MQSDDEKQKKKKKRKRKIILIAVSSVLGLILLILPMALLASGLAAILAMVDGLFGGNTGNANYNGADVLATVNNMDITEADAEQWMISRESLVYILTKTEEFNKRELQSVTCYIEANKKWKEYEPTPTPTVTPTPTKEPTKAPTPTKNPKATVTPVPTITKAPTATPIPTKAPTPTPFIPQIIEHDDTEYLMTTISEEQEIIDRYQIQWQLIYLLCTYHYVDLANQLPGNSREKSQEITYDDIIFNNGKVMVSDLEINWMMDAVRPVITYSYNPAEIFQNKQTVTKSEIWNGRYKKEEYSTYTQQERVVDSKFHYTMYQPMFKVEKVDFFYGTDYYTYKIIHYADGQEYEHVSVTRKYDRDKLLKILQEQAGVRDINMFTVALEAMPGTEELAKELRKVFLNDY